MSRLVVGPFNRVEGDLEVRLEVEGDRVASARVVSPLYRGFERMLAGKAPLDALVFAPRVCGICSVSQSVAAAGALAGAMGVDSPPNGRLAVNLVHATENLADHLTHFYLFFMPDFARAVYADEPWHADVAARFTALKGSAMRDAVPARAQLLNVMGLLAGKWPHTLGLQPGGTTRTVTAGELARLSGLLAGVRRFLETTLFGDRLERFSALTDATALAAWAAEKPAESSDARRFLCLAEALELEALGQAGGCFMSNGAYAGGASGQEGGFLWPRGIWAEGAVSPLDPSRITEDLSHAWYREARGPQAPFDGRTLPDGEMIRGYSWCKAPRLDGAVIEVGAVARQMVAGHPLVRDLVARTGGKASVLSRVVARLLEIALIPQAMERWVRALDPRAPFRAHGALPDSARGTGLTEAARGSLGHWLVVEKGVIANYQIIAPTTWNFSPRDADGMPGALEQALEGTPVRPGETEPVAVQHVVRSFDPCLVCTVH